MLRILSFSMFHSVTLRKCFYFDRIRRKLSVSRLSFEIRKLNTEVFRVVSLMQRSNDSLSTCWHRTTLAVSFSLSSARTHKTDVRFGSPDIFHPVFRREVHLLSSCRSVYFPFQSYVPDSTLFGRLWRSLSATLTILLAGSARPCDWLLLSRLLISSASLFRPHRNCRFC